MRLRGVAALLLTISGTAAYAQDTIYVGVGIGSFDYNEKNTDILLGHVSDNVSTYKLFGGFELNQHFTFEINYRVTDNIGAMGAADIESFGHVTTVLTTDFKLTSLHAVGQLPLDWGVLLGGLGYYTADNDFSLDLTTECCGSGVDSGTISNNGLTAMLGVEWRFGRFGTRYGIRLDYEWWDIDAVDTSAIGVGFSYGF